MLINKVNVVKSPNLPKLPVARALWKPMPDLKTAATAWIYAGGAHHTVFSQRVKVDQLQSFAAIAGIECIVIDENTNIAQFKKELRLNDIYYK